MQIDEEIVAGAILHLDRPVPVAVLFFQSLNRDRITQNWSAAFANLKGLSRSVTVYDPNHLEPEQPQGRALLTDPPCHRPAAAPSLPR